VTSEDEELQPPICVLSCNERGRRRRSRGEGGIEEKEE